MLIKIESKKEKEILFFEAVYCKKKGGSIYIKRTNGAEKEEINVKGKQVYVNSFELK